MIRYLPHLNSRYFSSYGNLSQAGFNYVYAREEISFGRKGLHPENKRAIFNFDLNIFKTSFNFFHGKISLPESDHDIVAISGQ